MSKFNLPRQLNIFSYMRQTSIFQQLIYNVVLPVVVALILLGVYNFRNTRIMLLEHRETRNFLISDELIQVLKFQDITLAVIEEKFNDELEAISNEITQNHLISSKEFTSVDLKALRQTLGLDPKLYDIYIIDTNGVVINTTFEKDLGLNFFSFGKEHEMHIRHIFNQGDFVNEKFTIEANTRRLKKYTYQPTLCGDFIVELGVYSTSADEVINIIKNMLQEVAFKHSNIVSAELFMNADDPFSLTITDPIEEEEKEFLKERFVLRDSITVEKRIDKRFLSYQYIYTQSNDSELYKGSVIRIVSDRTDEIRAEYVRMLIFILIFSAILFVIIILIYRKTKVITNPIKKLVEHVNRISSGNLSERADVNGSIEIVTLSRRFNKMIAELEELYRDLEQKVKDRTAEVVAQKEEIECQRDLLAEQQKHIMDSIQYSKRLQTAILPTHEFIKELFPESFVYYKPKDIISGDFYWFHQHGNKRYFSAIDCTGHGVPGALVSMVGQNWLNYAVKDLQLEKPSEILDALNNGVKATFKEKDDDTSVKDGMDLALCCVDYDTMTLEFAGAYNPVLIISNGEHTQIKGDKFPIGAFFRGNAGAFTNHTVKVNRNDIVYVFSDGFADQFGGPDNFKFLTKRFRELLIQIHQKPLAEQYEILDSTLRDWVGSLEQVDDITVIGIKI
ncbi:SpoIIE family protein phosphatase [Perlabentimonas gracilis]|uniref:SpoIIE family protein phosphatase n=1 Tax=Perlabentimonas gracilis TaxID=2715279 RepID=UPI001407DB58|nr:SpoIIE family protein phosphatase [Perlabentimonas gracilis]NHB67915.1 SpoIIE family protein phosphatase [Perlabentimonas gracilis]